MVNTKDRIIQDIGGLLSEHVFNGYCQLIFREVETLVHQANSFPTSSISSSFIESSKDLLGDLLEGLSLLQTPILSTFIPLILSVDDMKYFSEVQTNIIHINAASSSKVNGHSSLDIIDLINKQIEKDFNVASRAKIRLLNFVPYMLLHPVLDLNPVTFTFVYKTSVVYSYRTDDLKFLNPKSLYPSY